MDRGSRERRRAFLLLPLLLAAGSSGPAAAAPPITTYRIEATTATRMLGEGMEKLNPAGCSEPEQPEAKPRGFNPFRFF
jgi:hypothetical protein